ncbi:hypothetical protein [Acidovorax sp. MR-S7]|uniref:hypothetical protein n=1 Tax=Acidovorax sp. MR-S7 TaxID=1268622 RepID=UPI00118735C9|nr:hypothetical protein [Acidovorax sp. MR-S7]
MTSTVPIMSQDEERFMAFCGLLQWTQGVVLQATRVAAAEKLFSDRQIDHTKVGEVLRCEHHYFVVAAYKLIEHRHWVKDFGLCQDVDFSEIDGFPIRDIKDLRNMREHVVEYFQGKGREKTRWVVETPEYKADASSCVGSVIGGRLDYVRFAHAAERLLAELRQLPLPYPSV